MNEAVRHHKEESGAADPPCPAGGGLVAADTPPVYLQGRFAVWLLAGAGAGVLPRVPPLEDPPTDPLRLRETGGGTTFREILLHELVTSFFWMKSSVV